MQRVKLAAHRGYSAVYPENTLLAFKEALKLDVDMLEIDLHMTKDGEIILMHDHTVDRTTNGTGFIKDKTLAQMRMLDAGSWKSTAFAGEKVPLFREFLELVKDYPQMEINIELKDYVNTCGKERAFLSCDKSLALIEEYAITDRIYINCWSGAILQYIADKYPGKYRMHAYYPAELLGDEFDRESIYSKMFCACLFEYDIIDGKRKIAQRVRAKADFDYVKSLGLEAWVYYKEETPDLIKTSYENGAVGFTCNDPVRGGKILDEIGARKLRLK